MRNTNDVFWVIVVAGIFVWMLSSCGTTHTVRGKAAMEVSGTTENTIVVRIETDVADQINTICKYEVDFDICAKRIIDIYQGLTDAIEAAAKLNEKVNEVKPVTGVY